MPLREPRALAEDAFAERLTGHVRLAHAPASPQLGRDELAEVADRVVRVVLAQVDAVDAVLVEPALDRVGHLLGRADREEPRVPGLVHGGTERTDREVERQPALRDDVVPSLRDERLA